MLESLPEQVGFFETKNTAFAHDAGNGVVGVLTNKTLAVVILHATHLPRSEAATPAGERAAHRQRSDSVDHGRAV